VVGSHVGDRVQQQLAGQRSSLVAEDLRDDRRQVATGAVAGDGEPAVAAQVVEVLGGPASGRDRVLDPGRPGVLGSEAVVDRDDDRVAPAGDQPADELVGVEVAES
jgi:hypothetical protein